ncbi:MAG TPA: FliG C-terminal domain-containing protein [bacterium]|nr:FliG C-terminal domain-containing protein [bacterium]
MGSALRLTPPARQRCGSCCAEELVAVEVPAWPAAGSYEVTVDDLIHVDAATVQRVMRALAPGDVALVVKLAGDEARAIMFRALDQRAAVKVLAAYARLGRVELAAVLAAHQRLLTLLRTHYERGAATIAWPEPDVRLVW